MSHDGCSKEFSLSKSLKENEQFVVTKLKATGDEIKVTTRRIGHSRVPENNATINDYVAKIDTFSGKVMDLY